MPSKRASPKVLCRAKSGGTDPGSILGRQGLGSKATTGKAVVGAKESLQRKKTVKSGEVHGEV